LGKFKGVFGNFAINIIKSGESSGNLNKNLSYLAEELKKKQLLRKKIMSALLYPIIVTVATFGITGFLTVYIFPKIIPLFQSLNAKLPVSTRIVIYLTNVIRNDGWWILLGLAIVIIGIILMIKKIPKVRFAYDGFLLRIPIFGPIIQNYNTTNTMRTLGLLLKSGISINEALNITSDTTENVQYKKAFHDISLGIMKGKSISELIGTYPKLFPIMIGHMIAIGERSGNLSNTLIYLAEYYEHEFDDQTKNLSSTIEPVLMIIMGIMVGFIAISVISPIYEITNSLHK
jgi:type IV pilus assembly protein PilC